MAHPRKYSSAQKFHPLYRYAGILGFVLAIFLTNRVKPQGGLCNLSLSFLSADKLTTLKYRKHYKFSLESSQENLDTSLLNIRLFLVLSPLTQWKTKSLTAVRGAFHRAWLQQWALCWNRCAVCLKLQLKLETPPVGCNVKVCRHMISKGASYWLYHYLANMS